ncbi:hypothetical protein FA95DRAFT_1285386 [Auriscalpium vulgare]|uniref:Uncharacterized protein n=1 Tax=Auriscalpium vulgare TaxID=40419 RepID=A0ACB8RST4_9AGAM|nr:hypothetical protein FA95DRAFT_1285386 [Auriscalpium vulgare]
MSTRTAGTPVPAVIVSARDALLRASQSGPAGWEFNPFDVELGSPEDVQLDDLLDTDLWWWEKYDVALGLSSQLSVSLDDLRYALKLVPTNAERMLDDGELSTTPLLRAASQSTSAPPSADPTITSPVALPMRKRVNCSAEEDEEDSDDNGDDNGDDDTFSPTSLRKKRPRAKVRLWLLALNLSFTPPAPRRAQRGRLLWLRTAALTRAGSPTKKRKSTQRNT